MNNYGSEKTKIFRQGLLWFILLMILSNNIFAIKLKIGTEGFYPPFEYMLSSGELSGFDIELMQKICNVNNYQCSFKIYTFADLFLALDKRDIDLAISAIDITDERAKKYRFSIPYMLSTSRFIINNKSIKSIDDIKKNNLTIGVLEGDPYNKTLEEAHVAHQKIVVYRRLRDLLFELSKNKIQAAILDEKSIDYWVDASFNKFQAIGPIFYTGIGYGIAATDDEALLIKEIDKAILTLQANGFYLHLYKIYFGSSNYW